VNQELIHPKAERKTKVSDREKRSDKRQKTNQVRKKSTILSEILRGIFHETGKADEISEKCYLNTGWEEEGIKKTVGMPETAGKVMRNH